MQRAIDSVKKSDMSIKSAAKMYNVPRSTLQTKLFGSSSLMCRPGPALTLPLYIEEACEKYLIEMARRGFPLKINDLLIIQCRGKGPPNPPFGGGPRDIRGPFFKK